MLCTGASQELYCTLEVCIVDVLAVIKVKADRAKAKEINIHPIQTI